ncbi:efflux RND transporter periplasmic adaptor subunit [Roseivirga sp. BDSF3-8]|uniref:efflux RND transporter periplasmic adaptor subunit n=1 Tax=Roseivirga sp. BDSF3-8 TaxID=3241598 RepID=UPI003531A6EB
MKLKIYYTILSLIMLMLTACGEEHKTEEGHTHEGEAHSSEESEGHSDHEEGESVHLTASQFQALDMKVGPLEQRNINSTVQANGTLEVPPKNEALVTAIMGANIASIEIIEGDDVRQGQVLAYLRHPDITRMQSDYMEIYNRHQYLEQEYERQKKLYEAEVGSGKNFQQATAEYKSAQAAINSQQAQLRQLGINPARIRQGNFYTRIPVVSPIDGAITKVEVKTGQYVQPQMEMFEIVNTEHIHADLMVFEKDVHKVSEGQTVRFTVENLPGRELMAEIYSVGKKFEQDPKALHVHAEIKNESRRLIPGMYVRGEILTDSVTTTALPKEAITREGDDYLAFMAQQEGEEWMFTPVRVKPGATSRDWTAVSFLDEVPNEANFAMDNAYYLLAEMKKGEGGHHH